MSENLVNTLKGFSLALLAVAAVGYVYQYGRFIDQTYPTRTFSVDGEEKIELANDIALFTASVVTEGGKNVGEIQKRNVEKMNAINEFLKEQGVEEKDLQTEQYSLSPRYSYPSCEGQTVCPQPFISGYTLTQTLSVKVRDMDKIGDILSGVTTKGTQSVSGVSFTVDDTDVAKQKARTLAIEKAQKKARDMAKAGGFKLGKLVSLYEDQGIMSATDIGYGGMGGGIMEAKAIPVAPIIEPGTQSGKARVTLTYEIKN
ncbi:MAG: SIMPL domain-containing protein [Candidatus Moranbacteria bacterium]|nr:SIMPL domain-containing protein [Candidatus Moranbacteria bacterium]